MDPSVQFLLGSDVPSAEGASIHSIVLPSPESIDDDKIGFTLDVAVRLDREQSDQVGEPGVIVPIIEIPPQELADTA